MCENNPKDMSFMGKKWEGTSYDNEDNFRERLNNIGVSYAVVGHEVCPTTGRNHLQFYIETKRRIRWSTIGNAKHLNCAVFPLRRTVKKAISYIIQNEDKPNPIFFEIGQRPKEFDQETTSSVDKKKDNMKNVLRLARRGKFDNIAAKYPGIYLRSYTTIRKVYCDSLQKPSKEVIQCVKIIGKSGCGKTEFLVKHFQNMKAYFYNKTPNFWERYENEKILVIDDLDKGCRNTLYQLKVVCDRLPLLLNVKFGSNWSYIEKVLITSQYTFGQLIGLDEHGKCIDPELEEALLRRFTVLHAVGRDPETKDLFVQHKQTLFNFSLYFYLLMINFI